MRAEVVAVIVAVDGDVPLVLAAGDPPALPAGPLLTGEPSLQVSTRAWVREQTGRLPGYLEQLYTFADPGRLGDGDDEHVVSVSYLGLATAGETSDGDDEHEGHDGGNDGGVDPGRWRGWYELFPWEDQRNGSAALTEVLPQLTAWAQDGALSPGDGGLLGQRETRRARVAVAFGVGANPWRPDMALQRYELLYEAGLLPESPAAWRQDRLAPGVAMAGDHRRIVATGVARLRAKIEYRPVVFELLDDEFTLGQLQRCVEAIAGQAVHKQNFRRTVAAQDLVEETGGRATGTGGRPAKLFRFRRAVQVERHVIGTKLPVPKSR